MTAFPEFDPSVPHRPEEARQWLRDKALYDAITAMTELLRQMAYPRITVRPFEDDLPTADDVRGILKPKNQHLAKHE